MSPDRLWKRYLHCHQMLNFSGDNNKMAVHYKELARKYYKLWFRKAGYNT